MIAFILSCIAFASVAVLAAVLTLFYVLPTSESDNVTAPLPDGSSGAVCASSPPSLLERRSRSSGHPAPLNLAPGSTLGRRRHFQANPTRVTQPRPHLWNSTSPNRTIHTPELRYHTRSSPTPSPPRELPRFQFILPPSRHCASPISSTIERFDPLPPSTPARQEPAFEPQQPFYQQPRPSPSVYHPFPATFIPVPDSHDDATPPPPLPAHSSPPFPVTIECQPSAFEYHPCSSTSISLPFHENFDMEDVQETNVTSVAPTFVASPPSSLEGMFGALEGNVCEGYAPESEMFPLVKMEGVDDASAASDSSDSSDEDEEMTDQEDLMAVCDDYPTPADDPFSSSPPLVPFSHPIATPSPFVQPSFYPTSYSSNALFDSPPASPFSFFTGLTHFPTNAPPATPPHPVPSFLPIGPHSPTSIPTPFYSPLNKNFPLTPSPPSPLTAFSAFASSGPSTFASAAFATVPAWAARPAPSGTPAASSIPPPSTCRPMLDPRRAVRSTTAFVTNVPIVSTFATAATASPPPSPPPKVEAEEPLKPDFITGDAELVIDFSDEEDEEEDTDEGKEDEECFLMKPHLDIFGELDGDGDEDEE
ncbi:hypothetical protein RQP46_007044 [Phenoliferia psychrophenolica]